MRRGLLTGLFGALQVPFEQVPDLVASRRVLLRGGAAFVSRHEVASLVVGHFRAGLSHSLALTARRWAASIADEEAERLTPVVLSLSERCPRRRRTCQRADVHRGSVAGMTTLTSSLSLYCRFPTICALQLSIKC